MTKPICRPCRQVGLEETSTNWREVVERTTWTLLTSPCPHLHHDIAVAAAKWQTYLLRKPFAMTVAEARTMLEAAEEAGVVHYVNHNYRRAPAVMLAKRLIEDGRLATSTTGAAPTAGLDVGPHFPLTWHLQEEKTRGGRTST